MSKRGHSSSESSDSTPSSSSSSDSSEEKHKKHRGNESKRDCINTNGQGYFPHKNLEKKRKRSSSSSSSSTSSNDSDHKRKLQKRLKKRERKKRSKEKKKIKKMKKRAKKKMKKLAKKAKVKSDEIPSTNCNNEVPVGPAPGPPIPELSDRAKAMKPMTKEEWDKRQQIIRKVYDEETGRHRLIKGDGEILEEIVSRDRHRDINRQATQGDGAFFQAQLSSKLSH